MTDIFVALSLASLFFLVLFFILVKPQIDRLEAHKSFVKSLKVGDRVITAGGLVGKIINFPDQEYVNLEIAKGLVVLVLREQIYESYQN
jgi:preprotein translocase subunit YajC